MGNVIMGCGCCALAISTPLTCAAGASAIAPGPASPWEIRLRSLYTGPPARTLAELALYTGPAAIDRIAGRNRREACRLNAEQLQINYKGGVEFQLRQKLVILCPQTADLLYGDFTPRKVRYRRGGRPELERVVAAATAGCRSDTEKALALMRFCRDLRLRAPDADFSRYVYGGTEEELIEKPDILCETLSRLMVALGEIAGLPGRLVMHVLGGHIATEILVDGHWAYIDPRCGVYFRNRNGQLASVLELWRDPGIIRKQPEAVKRDVNPQWTWAFRAWKCENMYFNPREVNGFENYSLADAARYDYPTIPRQQALAAGLMEINRRYVAALRRGLGLEPTGWRRRWADMSFEPRELMYRNDGFSIYFQKPPMNRAELRRRYIEPFQNSRVSTLVWGVGPGSVFCYETKIGEMFGEGLDAQQRALLREGDLWVHENVMDLIRAGGPLAMAVEDTHAIGKKIVARLEMNHEYGPANEKNWLWVAFVGSLNKKHPEFRIPRSVLLDYKHPEVRAFKLAILRETARLGVDGVSLDFAVYPPFFATPDTAIMTDFVRNVRAMLDEEGKKQGRRLELMVRVPTPGAKALGLDWETWMEEHLIDVIFPTHRRFPDFFDLRIERFIDKGVETGVKICPTVWQALGFVDTDQRPGDKAAGRRRYDKPKTPGMYRAQALLFYRAGATAIQLGMSEDQWRHHPWMNDLGNPRKLLYAPKHYMVDPIALRGGFSLETADGISRGTLRVGLRLADDIAAAGRAGWKARAELVLYCRPLEPGETLALAINGRPGPRIDGNAAGERARREEVVVQTGKRPPKNVIFQRQWWKRGEHRFAVPADVWRLQNNAIVLTYTTANKKSERPFAVTWIDLLLTYEQSQTRPPAPAVDGAPRPRR